MPNNLNRPAAVHAVTLESNGWTYLCLVAPGEVDESGLRSDESAAYHGGHLVPSARPVRPVRCYEGARS